MSAELVILVSTAVLAVVALCAAAISVRAVRTLRQTPTQTPVSHEIALVERPTPVVTHLPASLAPRVVEGRLIVPPTQQQVVATALGRPGVRLSVFTRGVAYALRPESRDRILGMMRREYRRRRRERLQAGRRAARAATPSATADSWIGS
ncbi:hypothetical protein J2X11_001577 [Aeromicrobium panaciterrae]|uniref:Uncharacterized protein n=1 Tax=Aeromicrobium panaciterrae TaxID=363861 RepID=A0ABU1UNI0_9ACTN|nr:hypothetical protein [Aeromicrobium panaciterrae]MDR7086738.1 hypothetical protein [Aeromicrobium panaciterrae]